MNKYNLALRKIFQKKRKYFFSLITVRTLLAGQGAESCFRFNKNMSFQEFLKDLLSVRFCYCFNKLYCRSPIFKMNVHPLNKSLTTNKK